MTHPHTHIRLSEAICEVTAVLSVAAYNRVITGDVCGISSLITSVNLVALAMSVGEFLINTLDASPSDAVAGEIPLQLGKVARRRRREVHKLKRHFVK